MTDLNSFNVDTMEDLPSFKMMTISLWVVMIATHACNASISITEGGPLFFENKEKLSIMCTNDVDSIVQFTKSGSLLTSCVLSSGCTVSDQTFTVSFSNESSKWQYVLETVGNFTTDLCGSYECVDVLNGQSDTVNVSLKDFDNNSYFPEEKEDELSISTACVFPASLDDLEITWYTFDNGYLKQMSDADLDAFSSAPTNITCPNITCSISQAQSFTFGLGKFNGNQLSKSLVEVKIVHQMFKDNPLIWRSSNKYPVVVAVVLITKIGRFKIIQSHHKNTYKKKEKKMKKERERKMKEEKETKMGLVFELPLFSSFDGKEKRSIADSMVLKRIQYNGNGTKTVYMQYKLYVIVGGMLHVSEREKHFGCSCGFVNPFEFTMIPTLDTDIVNEDSHESSEKAKLKITIQKVPLNTKVEATKYVELLVMGSDNYTNILNENTKWQSILNSEVPPRTLKAKTKLPIAN
ncbi:uncharacterized protein LOC128235203 isoform X2 [Mya arenaria]|uniref:uncharacterized protein LOC128235203 isoform X2 n=1 Tax=Mya arenaria TaxID=6604 RepID=UPI0022E0285F|nr:uncharacterized protein LOC128235203 isoform X2 [Mya arenaria]